MRWIAGGIAGWIAAVAPLLGVNIAGYANVFDTDTAVFAGAMALLASMLLGGMVAGLLAGRPSETRAGGAVAALPAGIFAAMLYVVSLVIVVEIAIRVQAAPAVVADHPLRVAGATFFLGTILLGISLVFGMIAGRRGRQGTAAPRSQAFSQPRHPGHDGYVGQPARSANPVPTPPIPAGRDGYANQSGSNVYRDRRHVSAHNDPREYDDGQRRGYSAYDERQAARYPSASSPHPGGRNTARDDDWREGRRGGYDNVR